MNCCRFCGSEKRVLWADEPKEYFQCVDCLFISVDPLPTEEELDAHYSKYHDLNHQEDIKKNELRAESYKQEIDWLGGYVDFHSSADSFKIYDYGASGGYFLDQVKSATTGSDVMLYGDDKSLPAIEKLKEKGYYYSLEENKPNKEFDLVILRGLVEHVPDFKQLLSKVAESLKDGGFLFITATPNGTSTCAQLYRNHWVQHHYPGHIQHFSAHHFDYYLADKDMIRVDSVDLYSDSIYKKDQDAIDFIHFAKSNKCHFGNCKDEGLEERLGHAFFESMLTLLYRKM